MARVSPLKVRVFDACRLRYRYQYLEAGEGRARPRLRIADTAGSLVHRVLCDFYSKLPEEERTRERLLQLFEEGWAALSKRYLAMPGVETLHDLSLRQLENYADRFGLSPAPFLVEPYLQAEIEPGTVLFGRMDRIDEEADGTLRIIDYKTGEQPSEVDPRQLVLYAILVEEKLGRPVSKASFWYLDDGSEWTLDLGAEEKRRAREELLATVREMDEAYEFPPTIGPHCGFCPFLHACEFREEITMRREREDW